MLLSSTSVPLGAIFASGMICVFCLMRYDMISYQRRRDGNKRSPLDCVFDRKCVRWTAQETELHVSDGKEKSLYVLDLHFIQDSKANNPQLL